MHTALQVLGVAIGIGFVLFVVVVIAFVASAFLPNPSGWDEGPTDDLVEVELCPTCHNPDGSLDVEYLSENGGCVFGCGAVIDMDHGMCTHCEDHSANICECETCGQEYDTWNRIWMKKYAKGEAPRVCILTGADGENPDDCTTHEHEPGTSTSTLRDPHGEY